MSRSKSNGAKSNGRGYVLRSDRPVPSTYQKYPFPGMAKDIKKFFYLKPKDKPRNVACAACGYARNHGGTMKFAVRFDEEENKYGCWRVR